MRFLLLCPVALLLLTAPAKTDSVEGHSSPTLLLPLDSSASPATSQTSSPEGESESASTELRGKSTGDKPVLDQPDPEIVRKLRRELAAAHAELRDLNEEHKDMDATIETAHSKVSQLKINRRALSRELNIIRRMLREARDELSTQEEQCEPSESGLAKLIDEETNRQLEALKEEIELSYKTKFDKFLRKLHLKIVNQFKREFGYPQYE